MPRSPTTSSAVCCVHPRTACSEGFLLNTLKTGSAGNGTSALLVAFMHPHGIRVNNTPELHSLPYPLLFSHSFILHLYSISPSSSLPHNSFPYSGQNIWLGPLSGLFHFILGLDWLNISKSLLLLLACLGVSASIILIPCVCVHFESFVDQT